jgi:hypothetical protein
MDELKDVSKTFLNQVFHFAEHMLQSDIREADSHLVAFIF